MIYWLSGFDETPLGQLPPHVTHAFGLILNPMRGRTEERRFIAVCESREELLAAWKAEAVEPYIDGNGDETWRRSYRKGGPLEWFNPPFAPDFSTDQYGCGIIELRRNGWQRVA